MALPALTPLPLGLPAAPAADAATAGVQGGFVGMLVALLGAIGEGPPVDTAGADGSTDATAAVLLPGLSGSDMLAPGPLLPIADAPGPPALAASIPPAVVAAAASAAAPLAPPVSPAASPAADTGVPAAEALLPAPAMPQAATEGVLHAATRTGHAAIAGDPQAALPIASPPATAAGGPPVPAPPPPQSAAPAPAPTEPGALPVADDALPASPAGPAIVPQSPPGPPPGPLPGPPPASSIVAAPGSAPATQAIGVAQDVTAQAAVTLSAAPRQELPRLGADTAQALTEAAPAVVATAVVAMAGSKHPGLAAPPVAWQAPAPGSAPGNEIAVQAPG
ncbi:MAG: hypothetical protein IT556_15580, partial [Acetobacteraceae bacterium]|nr:hypothetical protein [Acetobacteraceae bacterium]